MRYILGFLVLGLVGCGSSSGSSPAARNAPDTTTTTSPGTTTTTSAYVPPGVTCAPFVGTRWTAFGSTYYSVDAQSQSGLVYVDELDMTVLSPVLISKSRSISGSVSYCTRSWAAVPYTGENNKIWPVSSGICGAHARWYQFDFSVCNEVTVIVRTDSGSIYEIQKYRH